MPVNHWEAAPLAACQATWLILIWPSVLLGAETSELLVLPANSQHAPRELTSQQQLRSPQLQKGFLTGQEPRPPPGLRYPGNFSISLLSLQMKPLADENKGSLWETAPITCFYRTSFMQYSSKHSYRQVPLSSPLQMAPSEKHRKLSSSVKVIPKVRAEVGKKPRAPCSQAITCPLPGLAISSQCL